MNLSVRALLFVTMLGLGGCPAPGYTPAPNPADPAVGASGDPSASAGPVAPGDPSATAGPVAPGDPVAPGGPVAPSASGVPQGLVGAWYAGRGHTSVPYNPGTGQWGTPSGSGLVYVFAADARYTKAFQSYQSNGGCTTGFTAFEEGVLIVADGGWLTTRPQSGHRTFQDTCAPSLNSDEPITELAEEAFSWELRPSEYDPSTTVLYLKRTDGAASEFTPL